MPPPDGEVELPPSDEGGVRQSLTEGEIREIRETREIREKV